jgi:hypothetical protein
MLLAVGTFALPAHHLAAEEVITVPTRAGVNVACLITHDASTPPKVVVISFVGGTGAIGLDKRSDEGVATFGPAANFLIRIRGRIAASRIVDVIVDAPSDRLPEGMSDHFRLGPEHLADIRMVIADLRRRYPGTDVYLMGTSRGTISAAANGAVPGLVQGIVLSSTVTRGNRSGPGLSGFDFASIKVPVLFVHHGDDGCSASPYGNVERLAKGAPLITVDGGDPPQTGPCEPLSPHGYFGRESAVAEAISHWILGEPFAREIH